jgi:hypothetical protein
VAPSLEGIVVDGTGIAVEEAACRADLSLHVPGIQYPSGGQAAGRAGPSLEGIVFNGTDIEEFNGI